MQCLHSTLAIKYGKMYGIDAAEHSFEMAVSLYQSSEAEMADVDRGRNGSRGSALLVPMARVDQARWVGDEALRQ